MTPIIACTSQKGGDKGTNKKLLSKEITIFLSKNYIISDLASFKVMSGFDIVSYK